ncbi:hypothetical protein ACFL21_03275, partial [Patescibacteria group bacterium]
MDDNPLNPTPPNPENQDQENSSKPAAEPAQPAAEPAQPATEPAQPAVEPEQPVVIQEQPAAEPAQPVSQSGTDTEMPTIDPETSPPSKNNKKWGILIGVGVIVVGVVAYLLAGTGLFKGQIELDLDDPNTKQIKELKEIGVNIDMGDSEEDKIEIAKPFNVSIANEEIGEIQIWSDKNENGQSYAKIEVTRAEQGEEIEKAEETEQTEKTEEIEKTEELTLPEDCPGEYHMEFDQECIDNDECKQAVIKKCLEEMNGEEKEKLTLPEDCPGEYHMEFDQECIDNDECKQAVIKKCLEEMDGEEKEELTLPEDCPEEYHMEFDQKCIDNDECKQEIIEKCKDKLGNMVGNTKVANERINRLL